MTAALRTAPPLTWRQRLLRLLPWHRRLALLACVGVFSWALSGMLHPLMSALQPKPAAFMPPQTALALAQLQAPGPLLQRAGIPQVQALRLLMLDGQPYYQVRLAGQTTPRYWQAQSGLEAALSGRHAEVLARHYLGTSEPLHVADTLTAFSNEYAFINRLLPAVRVESARPDGLRVYLDLYQDRLGTLVDNRKAAFSSLFLWLHSFHWLDVGGPLRPALMLLLLAASVAAVSLGVTSFLARRQARTRLRRWHGRAGIVMALATLAFVGSGAWHLLHKLTAEAPPTVFISSFNSSALTQAPQLSWQQDGEQLVKISLLQLDEQPVWRLQGLRAGTQPSLRYLAMDGSALDELAPQRYAEQRFAQYAAPLGLSTPATISVQRSFDHDYGFVFKRLPVLKASYADDQHSALFIDPLDGALAGRVNDGDRAEGWSFAYLHKWEWLGGISKTVKDVALSLIALAHLLLVFGGLYLWRKRRAR
jgi:hypothetical protein